MRKGLVWVKRSKRQRLRPRTTTVERLSESFTILRMLGIALVPLSSIATGVLPSTCVRRMVA